MHGLSKLKFSSHRFSYAASRELSDLAVERDADAAAATGFGAVGAVGTLVGAAVGTPPG
jgi:hypothetical protein